MAKGYKGWTAPCSVYMYSRFLDYEVQSLQGYICPIKTPIQFMLCSTSLCINWTKRLSVLNSLHNYVCYQILGMMTNHTVYTLLHQWWDILGLTHISIYVQLYKVNVIVITHAERLRSSDHWHKAIQTYSKTCMDYVFIREYMPAHTAT